MEIPGKRSNAGRCAARWAPWWVYLVAILGTIYGRVLLLPHGTIPEWADVVVAVAISAVVFVAVTAGYRAYSGRNQPRTC